MFIRPAILASNPAFKGVIRKSEEESRQRDYDYNKEGTESLRTRP